MTDRPPGMVVEQDATLVPECPYCAHRLTTVTAREVGAVGSATFGFGKRFAYACPGCNRLLGISHRKGFWMG